MKKILIHFFLVASYVSWILFFILSYIFFFPNHALQSFDHSLPSSYDFKYSDVINNGSILNPILEFSNITLQKNGSNVFNAKKFNLGIIFSPTLILGRVTVNLIHIEDANIILASNSKQTRSNLKMIIDKYVAIRFQNVSLNHMGSNIIVNGRLDSLLPGLVNGQLAINHNGEISNISISSDGESSNFFMNLYQLNWLQYFPNDYPSSSKAINFGINFIGSTTPEGSSFKGYVRLEQSSLDSFILKKNHGSFSFQSRDDLSTLKLSNFLHPFIDEKFPIKFNRRKQTITIPDIFLSTEVLQLKKHRFSNIAMKDVIASFKNGAIKYSGEIVDLDLLNIYFDEVLNIQGVFSGINNQIKFAITPSQSFIKNKDTERHPIQIIGNGGLTDLGFYLESKVTELAGSINLKLHMPINKQQAPLTIKLSGQNVSKKMILASLPKTLESTSKLILSNAELSTSNNIFLDYSGPVSNLDSNLLLKLSLDHSVIKLNESLDIAFQKGLIEINKDNLYISFSPGSVNQFPLDSLHGNLKFSNQHLQYVSKHDLSSKEISKLLKNNSLFADNLHAKAASKGFFNIFSQEQYNSLSIQTESFSIPIYQDNFLNLQKGQLFILEFDKLYGRLPAKFLNEDSIIFLKGQNLLDKYELDFLLEISLNPKKFIPDLSIFEISGEDIFSTVLSINKNSPPVLNIFSELKGLEFKSQLPFLQKSKSSLLPTDIVISNLSNPEIFVKNSLIEIKINSFDNLQGYIAIGKELPKKYNFIKQAKGLNLYLGLDTIASDILLKLPKAQVTEQTFVLNNFFFDIERLEIFNNQFEQINGSISPQDGGLKGSIKADKFNGKFFKDNSGFFRIDLQDTHFQDIGFLKFQSNSSLIESMNARLTLKNSSVQELQIKFLDIYLQKNKNLFTINNIDLSSNLMSISALSKNSQAYFSVDNRNDIYKLRGSYLIKDSSRIPILREVSNFSYFNGDINLQWQNLKRLQDIEGTLDFILKDLVVTNQATNSIALNLLGVLNLKNILGKVANLDLTIDEFTSTKLNRVQGDLVFSQSKARLASPLFIDTNAAKMKWIGQINKNAAGELSQLDLSLDLRVRIGENIPWYAAVLGGIPAVAGSALISEIFENNINDLSNYQYEVSGVLNAPKIKRMN